MPTISTKGRSFFIRPSAVLFAALCSCALAFPSLLTAGGPGTSAATFLELGAGARPMGLGEAFVAVADDASALYYNPAGLALRPSAPLVGEGRKFEASLSQALHVQGVSLTQAGLLMRPFGLSLTTLRTGDIERRTTETEEPEGKFGANDVALGLSYGRQVGPVALGVTGRFIRQEIGGASASAFAADLGAIKRLDSYPVSLGFGIANLGTKLRFVDESYPLPLTVRMGFAVGMTKKFPHVASLQVDLPRNSSPVVRLGAEYLGFGPIALRAGYRTVAGTQRAAVLGKALGSEASGLSEMYGFFAGLGLRSRWGNLDYSLSPYGELGTAHRLSISLAFGKLK